MRLLAGFLLSLALPAEAVTIRVPEDHPTISAALVAAGTGDVIELAPGLHSPSRTGEAFPLELNGKDVTLSGGGMDACVLDAEGGSALLAFSRGSSATVRGLTLRGGRAESGGAIVIEGASPELSGLRFTDNESTEGGDAIVVLGGAPTIRHCLFTGNRGAGTIAVIAGAPTLEYLTFHENAGPAVSLAPGTASVLRYSVVSRPGEAGGLSVGLFLEGGGETAVPFLESNLFADCLDGVLLVGGRTDETLRAALDDARRADGLREGEAVFENPGRGDFRLREDSPGRRPAAPVAPELGAFAGPDPLPSPTARRPVRSESRQGEEVGLLGPTVPNPFRPATTIHFQLKERSVVDLGVYNILGQRVRTLHAGDLSAGEHARTWDGRDELGIDVPPGIYFVRITQGLHTESRRLVLVR